MKVLHCRTIRVRNIVNTVCFLCNYFDSFGIGSRRQDLAARWNRSIVKSIASVFRYHDGKSIDRAACMNTLPLASVGDTISDDDAEAKVLPRSEYAYRYIREAIRSGRFKSGDRLREVDLATELALSRTPVRQALARLEANGLLVNDPVRGLVVTELDFGAINELYYIREVLEGTAARLAAQHASDVELSILSDLCEQYRAAADDEDLLEVRNRQFHDMLCQCAHNRYLLNTVASLYDSLSLLGGSVLTQSARARETFEEHEAITEAICRRDPDAAEKAIREHIRRSQIARLKRLFVERRTGN
jgi:DNA-binding GntR family transcriptional regulator